MKDKPQLELESCPHCGVSHPVLKLVNRFASNAHDSANPRQWTTYVCTSCGGVTLTVAVQVPSQPLDVPRDITGYWPKTKEISPDIPERPRAYLTQALASRQAPAGAIMLAASSIDAMLKEKGYKAGSLNTRINDASNAGVITQEMATWAHEIRLDANDQRHADESAPLPTPADVDRVVAFAQTLAEFLYVIPAMVTRGRASGSGTTP